MLDSSDSSRLLATAASIIERREAEILLAGFWNKTRAQLLASAGEAVPAAVAARFEDACQQRAAGVPVAYLLGRREFWSLDFAVSPAVLVPRPETELLVERLLTLVATADADVADLGTGSGAVAIALAHERPGWRIVGTDCSAAALAVARQNGEQLVGGRVEWAQGDWFGALHGRRFHGLASNPPYVAENDAVLQGDGLRFEPHTALTPGGDGFGALVTLINGAPEHLHPGGWLALEHGTRQGEVLRSRLVARGFTHVTSHRDLAGHERVTEGKLAP
jgi:release factor glutamine methyltransferase